MQAPRNRLIQLELMWGLLFLLCSCTARAIFGLEYSDDGAFGGILLDLFARSCSVAG